MTRPLIAPLIAAVVMLCAGQVLAQGAFPAPLPGRAGPVANDPAFPPVNGAAPTPSFGGAPQSAFPAAGAPPMGGGMGGGGAFAPPGPSQAGTDQCMKEFVPLREEAEKRGKLIKAASDRHAPPDEACKLIGNFAQSEVKMIKYIEVHAAGCGIPPQIADQLKNGHKNTDAMQKKVCAVAQQMQQQKGPAGPSLSDVLGSSAALPEVTSTKKGGAFDTLTGNPLTR
jgi:hypothetical protein